LGLCIQGYTGHIAAGEYRAAFEQIMSRLPLPESVCRVCHHPCEQVCVRADIDEPVAINELKRFVIDWAHRNEQTYQPARDEMHGKKVAVIGAGPSGLAAAHDLILRGYQVSLYDAAEHPGGLLRYGIPDYRLPKEALARDIDRILAMGVEFIGGRRLGRDLHPEQLLKEGFDSVYLAVGAACGIELRLENNEVADAPAMIDALDYLNQVNSGTEMTPARRVVVIGGGNAALDAARTARRLGAEQVVIAYRRRREEMPAIEEEIKAAEAEGVEIQTQLQPQALGAQQLQCLRTEPGETDSSGRSRPVPIAGSQLALACDQIITAIGQFPTADLLSDAGIKREEGGMFIVDAETGQTSMKGVFAGGDLVPGERTVTDAIAFGQRAAWGIDLSLRGQEAADGHRIPPRPDSAEPAGRPDVQRSDTMPRVIPEELTGPSRNQGFDEVVSVLTEEQARAEASRCMVCGLCGNCRTCLDLFGCPAFYVKDDQICIEPELCNGCGVCADLCPNGAIYKVSS